MALSPQTLGILHRSYDKRHFCLEDFEEDVGRIYSVMRMLRKYAKHGYTTPRALVNNIVIIYNVFGVAATLGLDEEVDDKIKVLLDSCLVYMGRESEREVNSDFVQYLDMNL